MRNEIFSVKRQNSNPRAVDKTRVTKCNPPTELRLQSSAARTVPSHDNPRVARNSGSLTPSPERWACCADVRTPLRQLFCVSPKNISLYFFRFFFFFSIKKSSCVERNCIISELISIHPFDLGCVSGGNRSFLRVCRLCSCDNNVWLRK